LRLELLGPGDHARLRAWLTLASVEAWWGTRGRAEAEIALALDSPSALCRIVRVDGEPIGYAHALDAALLDGGSRGAGPLLESGTWECVTFIASEAHRGLGLGEAALRALVDEVFTTTLAVACILRVPVSKEPAVRAVEAAGFRWVRIEEDAARGRVWLMRCERPRR
jgi:aminoglycoside 6'-N-acetyltransferase